MPLFRTKISAQVIKVKSDKYKKRALREARKLIKRGELSDSHSFALFLQTIEARYTHIKTDITNSTRVVNYPRIRAAKMAETRQLLGFFSQDYAELERLSQIVSKKAEQAGRIDDFKQERFAKIDLTKLNSNFETLEKEEK